MSDDKQLSRRSSFETKPTNQQWGTIVKTNMHLGHRKASKEEISEITERLSATSGQPGAKPPPDNKRIGALKDQGITNSYAWKGW